MGALMTQIPDELNAVVNARRGIGAPISPLAAVFGGTGFSFRSNYTPELTVQPGALAGAAPSAASSGGSSATAFLESAQPTVEAILPDGSRVTIFAPYGEATGDYRVYVAGVLIAVVGSMLLALTVAYSLGKRAGRRRRR